MCQSDFSSGPPPKEGFMDIRSMQSVDLHAARRFRRLFIGATAFIALIAVSSNILLWLAPQPDRHDATVLNIAGRQRMLSQKIAKAATVIHAGVHELDHSDIAKSKAELQSALAEWIQAQEALINGHPGLMLEPTAEGPIREQLLALEPCFQQVVDSVSKLLAMVHQDSLPNVIEGNIDETMHAIYEGEQEFLPRMHHIVGLLERDAAERASRAGTAWAGLSLAMLVILAALAISLLIIFEPAMRMLHQKIRDLRHALEAAEEVSRMKSTFLANVSHEIRTPMTAILGFADLLLDDDRTLVETHDAARTIRLNGQHLVSIINDILDLSKIEAGRMTVESIDCSPERIMNEVGSLMQVRAESKRLKMTIECDRPFPAVIKTDPVRLRQILINLVGNAIKFTESGYVRLRAQVVQNDTGDALLRFDVVDTGIGLTNEQAETLFDPFVQADESTTRRFGGTGLGLAISARFASMLEGDLTVQSTPETGSTFSLVLNLGPYDSIKLCDEPAAAQNRLASPTGNLSLSGRILLVEDGPDNQRLFSYMLTRSGAEVQVAPNGKDGLNKALEAAEAGNPFNLVLMDMQMPVMDGYEATSTLRGRGYNHPIVALTAHAMTGDRVKCLAAGCDEYLAKPIDRASLIAACGRWMHEPDNARHAA